MNNTSLAKSLENANIDFSPPFVHGVLSAYACIDDTDNGWAIILQPEIDSMNILQKEALNELNTYKDIIVEQLLDNNLGFQPLFSHDSSIRKQALSTREWVSGFWLAVSNKGDLVKVLQDKDSTEFIQDLQRITAMPLPNDNDIDNQQDLLEVQEYCRIGAIGLFLTLRSDR
ncbi:MAG: YecA/YgfB family protein [Ostreibacterium sp.]